ncbi:unnamed protein product [Toxocara canis]|uniref:ZP domain-containing protein n=1 Tax=Toxocara canis TaxID=6265 RepID=A0A183TXP4_TOXCA|nr:unnamed protein product [Toxocara canis]
MPVFAAPEVHGVDLCLLVKRRVNNFAKQIGFGSNVNSHGHVQPAPVVFRSKTVSSSFRHNEDDVVLEYQIQMEDMTAGQTDDHKDTTKMRYPADGHNITVEYDADTKGFCEFRSLDNSCVMMIDPPKCNDAQNVSEMGNSLQFICCCNDTHLCNHGGYEGGHVVFGLRDPE